MECHPHETHFTSLHYHIIKNAQMAVYLMSMKPPLGLGKYQLVATRNLGYRSKTQCATHCVMASSGRPFSVLAMLPFWAIANQAMSSMAL
jgi:hypothetical protein